MRYIVFLLFSILLSCQEDKVLTKVCADPLGSAQVTLKNNQFICFKEGHNACFKAELLTNSQSIWAIDYNSIYPGTMIGKIADIAGVDCLGTVLTKPDVSVMVYKTPAILGHGYVVNLPDNTYGRIYVDSWTKSASGTVISINLVWQYSF